MPPLSFLDDLRWRNQLHDVTSEPELTAHLETPGRLAYAGFDPTADSLTIGNFIPIKLLMAWQRAGHQPIVVMGGGTGLIGDPSGKDEERRLLTREQVDANIERQREIFERVLDFDPKCPNRAIIVNNADWLGELRFVDVLRGIGKHFSVNAMIQKESVKARLDTREHGISYTEFSYMLLQAYDFLHLRRELGCTVQLAGSDQFGNIVCGIDLIRREFGHEEGAAFGITVPLVTRSDGKKIGKTEKGAVWLSPHRTSPYAFYQYWINLDDDDVVPFLKWFTMMEREEIEAIAREHAEAPQRRTGQRALARNLTRLLHGETELARAEAASAALFSGAVRELDEAMLDEVFADVVHSTHDRGGLDGGGVGLVEILPLTSLASSKREARQFLDSGAISVNGERVAADYRLTGADLLHGRTILLRRGKKSWHATRWG